MNKVVLLNLFLFAARSLAAPAPFPVPLLLPSVIGSLIDEVGTPLPAQHPVPHQVQGEEVTRQKRLAPLLLPALIGGGLPSLFAGIVVDDALHGRRRLSDELKVKEEQVIMLQKELAARDAAARDAAANNANEH